MGVDWRRLVGGVDWRTLVGITRSRLIGASGVHREALLENWNTTNHPHLQVSEFSTNIIDYSHTVEIFCTVYNIYSFNIITSSMQHNLISVTLHSQR